MFDFEKAITRLIHYREQATLYKEKVKEIEASLRERYKELYADKHAAQRSLEYWDNIVREAIKHQYKKYGQRKPYGKLGVRITKVPQYKDQSALQHIVDKCPEYLTYDKKRFDKYLREGNEVPFEVEWTEQIVPTIPKQLEKETK